MFQFQSSERISLTGTETEDSQILTVRVSEPGRPWRIRSNVIMWSQLLQAPKACRCHSELVQDLNETDRMNFNQISTILEIEFWNEKSPSYQLGFKLKTLGRYDSLPKSWINRRKLHQHTHSWRGSTSASLALNPGLFIQTSIYIRSHVCWDSWLLRLFALLALSRLEEFLCSAQPSPAFLHQFRSLSEVEKN